MSNDIDPILLSTSQIRIWTLEGGANPGVDAVYQGRGRATASSWAGGDIKPIRSASNRRYGDYITVGKTRGQQELPTTTIVVREERDVRDMLTLFQKRCTVDLQLHKGNCQDPTDWLAWDSVTILEGAAITSYAAGDQGAFDGDQEAPVEDTMPMVGDTMYDVKPLRESQIAAAAVVQEIVGVSVCDGVSCGNCGAPSDGASVVFAVTKSHGGSPGLAGEIIFTSDGGATASATLIDTLPANKDASDLACSGLNLAVISGEDLAIHYAPIANILLGTETWTRIATGLVALKLPNRIVSRGRAFNWIAADGGYIYFSSEISAGVTVQTDGSITAQNLVDISACTDNHVLAVGASNAVLYTSDGQNWSSVVGPNVGVALTACWMKSPSIWLIGDATGKLWYTNNTGASWHQITAFTGTGTGSIADIVFATQSVGYMSQTISARGWLLRTIDGGQTWARVPDGGSIVDFTDNDKINRLAVADSAPDNVKANILFAGGLAADSTDGVFFKVA